MGTKYNTGDFNYEKVGSDPTDEESAYLLEEVRSKKKDAKKPEGPPEVMAATSMCCCCCCIMVILLLVGGFLYRLPQIQQQDPAVITGAVLLALGASAFMLVCLLCFLTCILSSTAGLSTGSQSDEIKLDLKRLNHKYQDEGTKLESLRLDVTSGFKVVKEKKKKENTEKKKRTSKKKDELEAKVKLDLESGLSTKQVMKRLRPCAFKIDFNGDIQVSSIELLREQISCIVSLATPGYDQVVVLITSPGGSVTMYGLAASQLVRIKKAGLKLVVCVDSIAASGGYLMGCVADEICAAPFALVGSIGVISIVPNVQDLLSKHDIHTHIFTAGKYKNTVNVVGEVTEEGKKKFTEELEEIHVVFKDHITIHRPKLKEHIDDLATGEAFLAVQAKQKGLIDRILTSDEYFESISNDFEIIHVKPKKKKSLLPELQELVSAKRSLVTAATTPLLV